jgi:hypothetical protein
MKKLITLLCLQFLVIFNSYSQSEGIPLKMINLGDDIESFELKLTPSAKKMYDEVISKYLGDIQSYEIEIGDSFYDFTVGLKSRKYLYVSKVKHKDSPEKIEIHEKFDSSEVKYKKITLFYFKNEGEKYDRLEFFLFPY